jgi:uracil-DNA glycosylase
MEVNIEESWKNALAQEFNKEYFFDLIGYVKLAYSMGPCYPPGKWIFRAFDECPLAKVKVVILGQDPYHGPGQANGLCFSVNEGVTKPPSLVNIFNELQADLGVRPPETGNLIHWAKQGVLLLNSILSVEAHQAGSHQKKGWEEFTDAVIQVVNDQCKHVVFILWGSYAQKKGFVVDREKHLVLSAPHPSPLSAHRGFFGSRPFSRTNSYLVANGKRPVDWVK